MTDSDKQHRKVVDVDVVEMYFDAIAAAIANRCYQPGDVDAMRWLVKHVGLGLIEIRNLLDKS